MRILLAEDEVALSKALTAILKHNNYSVDAVYNGVDALEYISFGIYDLAILDIMMPKMDGISVLKKTREKGIDIPIIMLTAKTQLDDKVVGLDSGADDYITKPFESRELLSRINAVLRRRNKPLIDKLSFGDLTLERGSFLLISGQKSVKLGAKEFQIMEIFMELGGKIISSEKLLDKIWDIESSGDPSVVWVYISGLRKKLVALESKVSIKANRNIGYYLENTNG